MTREAGSVSHCHERAVSRFVPERLNANEARRFTIAVLRRFTIAVLRRFTIWPCFAERFGRVSFHNPPREHFHNGSESCAELRTIGRREAVSTRENDVGGGGLHAYMRRSSRA